MLLHFFSNIYYSSFPWGVYLSLGQDLALFLRVLFVIVACCSKRVPRITATPGLLCALAPIQLFIPFRFFFAFDFISFHGDLS